ncbi:flagellar assembly protein FliW [Desulfotalea psychrophila]|uniref:Flagellar assembly factor FliW 1 n=1 Tax=Desulfotalea psychrophila (strain LSv54 / DSM 12343) TaxID=177439 RepID=FLIW1_DESPS|nr:flagellar assembly protein FliW [Desulfotalea psychrophila]Q6AMR4.1 RecName: Full=Flagellar assembly factor FliW 1 [Desulfotalea psychrophila LSv54]CAG36361.1 conserved hypothetical protein [Desulfotalea psychrophila LSv54]
MTSVKERVAAPSVNFEKILFFPEGIPGFEDFKEYRIFHKETNGLAIYWLESCDDAAVTFTLVAPDHYGLHYDFNLSDEEQTLLQAEEPMQLAIFLIVSKGEGQYAGLNANISGPIVINVQRQRALQKVLQQSRVLTTIIDQ